MSEQAFYLNPEFWVTVAFFLFIALIARPLARSLTKLLDARSTEIANELAEAKKLRGEAQALLEMYQKKQKESLKEAEEIIASTKAEAEALAKQSEADLKTALEKRMKLAMDKIARAEDNALKDVQNHVVDIAVAVARTIITDHLARHGSDEIVKQSAAELERKLH
jgi:F-type H+-transporting ATPase subunit b